MTQSGTSFSTGSTSTPVMLGRHETVRYDRYTNFDISSLLHGVQRLSPTGVSIRGTTRQDLVLPVASNANFDVSILALMAADDIDAVDEAIVAVRQDIRATNRGVVEQVAKVARDDGQPDSIRERALFALAESRVGEFEPILMSLIDELCKTGSDALKLSAIAAATHLSASARQSIRPTMMGLSANGAQRIQKAALAFLRR